MNRPTKFVNGRPLSFTLRTMLTIAHNPRFWSGLAIAIIILAISGPFNTQNTLNLPQRFVYWSIVCTTTFFIGIAVSSFIEGLTVPNIPRVVSRLAGGLLAGIPIALWIWVINRIAFQTELNRTSEFWDLLIYCPIIALCVTTAYELITGTQNKPHIDKSESARSGAAFFARLSKPIGTDLICLQAKDHYLEVTTSNGMELILLRLGDAEKELLGHGGLRIHRSHWVSKVHVMTNSRENGQPFVTLSNGTKLPVSRSYVKNARAAGII